MEYKEMHCISKGLVYITTNLMNFIYNRYILCYDNFEMYDVSDDKNGVLSYLFVFDARKVKKYKLILRVESDSCYMSLRSKIKNEGLYTTYDKEICLFEKSCVLDEIIPTFEKILCILEKGGDVK